jgi:anti-anti-sigma factor
MIVSILELNNATIVKVEEEKMLGYSGTDFQEAVMASIKSDKTCTIVDLSKVTFISSWGLGMILYGFTSAQNKGKEFMCAGVCENVRNSFSKTKLDSVIKLYDSLDDAINAS